MGGVQSRISPQQLYQSIGTAAAPLVIDVRRADDFDADDVQIVGTIRRFPGELEKWAPALPRGRRVIVYCLHGQQARQGVAAEPRAAGWLRAIWRAASLT